MIRVSLASTEVQTGESITGEAVWNSEGEKKPRRLEVVCRWRIEGKVKNEEEVGSAEELEIGSRSQAAVRFEFQIPLHGPLTYDGKLFRVVWEVIARADIAFARDEVDTKVFTVKPRPWDPDMWSQDDLDEDFDDEDLEGEDLEDENLDSDSRP